MINARDDLGLKGDGSLCDDALASGIAEATRKGTSLYLPTGVYGISRTLLLPSGARLSGAGPGTVLRETNQPGRVSPIVEGAQAIAVVAGVGVKDVWVSDLTIDVRQAPPEGCPNGLSFLAAGEGYVGRQCEHIQIGDVRVLSNGLKPHWYAIWLMRVNGAEVHDCFVDGGIDIYMPGSQQEGIEALGGSDIDIFDNHVQNIGRNGINLGASREGHKVDLSLRNVFVASNAVRACGCGVYLGTACDPVNGPQGALNVTIAHNTLLDCYEHGVSVRADDCTSIKNLLIHRNAISGCRQGILLYAQGSYNASTKARPELSNAWPSARVTENSIEGTRDPDDGAIATYCVDKAPRVEGNVIGKREKVALNFWHTDPKARLMAVASSLNNRIL